MRKTISAASVLGLAALALAGCASAPTTPEACGRVAADDSELNGVSVSGDLGGDIEVTGAGLVHADDVEYVDQTVGEGPVISSMTQGVSLDIVFVDPATGASVTALQADNQGQPVVMTTAALAAQVPGLPDALQCASEGSRVVAALGADGMGEQFGPSAQAALQAQAMQAGDKDAKAPSIGSILTVIDVDRVALPAADGAPVYNEGFGLPSVVRDPDGVPGVTIPDRAAPKKTVTETLLKGSGDAVGAGDIVTVQYTSVDWSTKSVANSTWQSGTPTTSGLDALPEGFADALEGVTVGSQILLVTPGDDGEATASVIDVLGVVSGS